MASFEFPPRDSELDRKSAKSTQVRVSIIPVHDDDDMVYMAQRTTQEGQRDTAELVHVDQFDTDDYTLRSLHGALRGDESTPHVHLFSRAYVGLAVSTVVAGFASAFLQSALLPLFTAFVATSHSTLAESATTLLQWPPMLSVLIGLLSDALPLFGFRRKSYLILGWLVVAVACAAMIALGRAASPSATESGYAFLGLSFLAATGVQVVWVVALATTVECAQRERLHERGHFQGAYFLLYYTASAITQAVTSNSIVRPGSSSSNSQLDAAITLEQAAAIMVVSALLPLPFVAWFLADEHDAVASTARDARGFRLARHVRDVYAHTQQKTVYRIYFFLCALVFLINAKNASFKAAILQWSGVSASASQLSAVVVAQTAPKVVAVAIWKCLMINLNWRVLGLIGLVAYAACDLVLLVTTGLALVRRAWFFYAWTALAAIPLGWFEVFLVVLPTEGASMGREGASMGLISSFTALITVASGQLWTAINRELGVGVTAAEVAADTSATRQYVVAVGAVYILLNVSSVALVRLLPTQKLDAQKWLVFGGRNRPASSTLLLAFALLLAYNAAASLLTTVRGGG